MNDTLLNPVSIYRYRRHVKPDGSTGTRWDLLGFEGKEQKDLFSILKKTGDKIIYLGKQQNKEPGPGAPEYALRWSEERQLLKHGKEIMTNKVSGIFEPEIKRPGCGYGYINNSRDVILIHRTELEMTILVIERESNNSPANSGGDALFKQWGTGAVRESIPSNNVYLNTETVQVSD